MADDKMEPVIQDAELVRQFVESVRRGHNQDGFASKMLALARGIELIFPVRPEDGVAFFSLVGSDLSEINDWVGGIRKMKLALERHPDVEVRFCGTVFVPGIAPNGSALACERSIDDILETGENGICIGPIWVQLYGRGCPLPPGLVPRLLKSAEAIGEAEVGDKKEADTSAAGSPRGALLRCTRHVGTF